MGEVMLYFLVVLVGALAFCFYVNKCHPMDDPEDYKDEEGKEPEDDC